MLNINLTKKISSVSNSITNNELDENNLNICNNINLKRLTITDCNTDSSHIITKTLRHFPPSTKEWNNSVYSYNKNNILKYLPSIDKSVYTLLTTYFNLNPNQRNKMFHSKLYKSTSNLLKNYFKSESAIYSRRFKSKYLKYLKKRKYNKLSMVRLFISKPEIKHYNNKIIITVYTYNRKRMHFIKKLKKIFKIMHSINLKHSDKIKRPNKVIPLLTKTNKQRNAYNNKIKPTKEPLTQESLALYSKLNKNNQSTSINKEQSVNKYDNLINQKKIVLKIYKKYKLYKTLKPVIKKNSAILYKIIKKFLILKTKLSNKKNKIIITKKDKVKKFRKTKLLYKNKSKLYLLRKKMKKRINLFTNILKNKSIHVLFLFLCKKLYIKPLKNKLYDMHYINNKNHKVTIDDISRFRANLINCYIKENSFIDSKLDKNKVVYNIYVNIYLNKNNKKSLLAVQNLINIRIKYIKQKLYLIKRYIIKKEQIDNFCLGYLFRSRKSYKIFISKKEKEIKHNKLEKLDQLIFSKQIEKNYREKTFLSFILKKHNKLEKLDKHFFLKTLEKDINDIKKDVKYIKMDEKYKTHIGLENENKNKKNIQKQKELKIKRLYFYKYLCSMLYFNSYLFNANNLLPLKDILKKVYSKKIELNIINLKYLYLDSNIFAEAITRKLRDRNKRVLRVLKLGLNLTKQPHFKIHFHKDIIKLNYTLFDRSLNININSKGLPSNKYLLVKPKDYKLRLFLYHMKQKIISGIRLEGAGRLTKRLTASRAISKFKYMGSLKNINSSYESISTVMLRGFVKSNLQYTNINSYNRNGSFGTKISVSVY